MRPSSIAPLVAVLLTSSLVACSGEEDPGLMPESPSSSVVVPDLPEPPDVQEAQGATDALQLEECGPVDGPRAKVSGTLTSTAEAEADWLVVLTWTNPEGDVLGRGYRVVQDLKPGKSRHLTITAEVAEGAETCVPSVLYGRIKPS